MSFDINTVSIAGIVDSGVEERSDKTSVTFSLSSCYELHGMNKEVSVPIVAYGQTALAVKAKLNVGDSIHVSGTLRRDKDGNLIIAALDILRKE